MGKYRNIFFSEAIALIEPKLCINHWKVLYKFCVFNVAVYPPSGSGGIKIDKLSSLTRGSQEPVSFTWL
jgi:hypothetical protein